jgi:quercetin dioxygenase-like cupin family protein
MRRHSTRGFSVLSSKRPIIALALFALLINRAPAVGAFAQPAPTSVPLSIPPGPVTHFPTRFDVVDAPAQFRQVLLVVDFPAGSWTPLHAPGGYVYSTVIEGEIYTRNVAVPDQDATYEAGSTFVETPGDYVQVGNASTVSARVVSTALLPINAPLTIYRDGVTSNAFPSLTDWNYSHDIMFGVPGPTTFGRASVNVDRPAGALELVQLVLDLDPGISTPRHMHGGQEFSVVTVGSVTLQRGENGQAFGPGESWVNASGLVHAAGNEGPDLAQVVATFLLPAGRPLTTVAY